MKSILENELFEAFAAVSENVYIYVCDVKTNMSRWSPNAINYFGLGSEYIEDAATIWGKKIHPADIEAYNEDISAVFTGKKMHHSCQYRAMNKDGDYVWLECKGTMINDENGAPSVFAGMMTRLDYQNKYDSLTGLQTIYSFHAYDITNKKGAAILIGIDNFRRIISNYGYAWGDDVLVSFSKMLKENCTDNMLLFRMNGDEFLILAENATEDDINKLFAKVKSEARNITVEEEKKVSLSISAGTVIFPDNGDSKTELLNNMEYSLEYIKSENKGNICFYSGKVFERYRRIQILKDDLKNSINNNFKGFELFYQPFISPKTGRIKGCEALLRWKGEKIKDSYPGEFIKILEDSGEIIPVGLWVMEESMRQQKAWQEKYGDICISFNVSYQQFMHEDFIDKVIKKAEEYGVNPASMMIELTESCHVEQPEALARAFTTLISEGFQIALDDFGTAYASLEMLKKVPTNFIKIEHSFVRELAEPGHEIDYIIIENLLSLCRRLDCKAVIEGVENEKVNDITKDMGATFLQGYYFAKPVCKDDFEEMLKKDSQN